MSSKTTMFMTIEGTDAEGCGQVGSPISIIIEGHLPASKDPEKHHLFIIPERLNAPASTELDFSGMGLELSLADFMSGPGPYLCQMDFEPEAVGEMLFTVELHSPRKTLASVSAIVRIINPTRDAHGRRLKSGSGIRKVKG